MKLEKELVAASSVPLVLSILSEGDSYGYAIIQRVKELSKGKIKVTEQGMLIPGVALAGRIKGSCRANGAKAENGRKRKYYSLRAGWEEGTQGTESAVEYRDLGLEATVEDGTCVCSWNNGSLNGAKPSWLTARSVGDETLIDELESSSA